MLHDLSLSFVKLAVTLVSCTSIYMIKITTHTTSTSHSTIPFPPPHTYKVSYSGNPVCFAIHKNIDSILHKYFYLPLYQKHMGYAKRKKKKILLKEPDEKKRRREKEKKEKGGKKKHSPCCQIKREEYTKRSLDPFHPLPPYTHTCTS